MKKTLHRIVSVLLICTLLVDPHFADMSWGAQNSPFLRGCAHDTANIIRLQQDALSLSPLSPRITRIRPFRSFGALRSAIPEKYSDGDLPWVIAATIFTVLAALAISFHPRGSTLAWMSVASYAILSMVISNQDLSRNPQNPYDLFKPIDGSSFTGRRLGNPYNFKLIPGDNGNPWKVAFVTTSENTDKEVGSVSFLFDPNWPMLNLMDAQVTPYNRKEGLYSKAVQELVNASPQLTRIRLVVEEERTLIDLYEVLPDEYKDMYRISPEMAHPDIQKLSDVLQWAIRPPGPEAGPHAVAHWGLRMLTLSAEIAKTPLGRPLAHAGVKYLYLVSRDGRLYVEGIAGLKKFWDNQDRDDIYWKSLDAAKKKEHIRDVEGFVTMYITTFQVPPSAEIVKMVYILLSRNNLELEELYAFFTGRLSGFLSGPALEDLGFHNGVFVGFISNHNKNNMIDAIASRKPLDLRSFPILDWALTNQAYNIVHIQAVEEILYYLKTQQSGEEIDWTQAPTLKEVYDSKSEYFKPFANLSVDEAVRSLNSSPLLRMAYTILKPKHRKPPHLTLFAYQAYWARSLVKNNGAAEGDVLKWLLDMRRARREAASDIGKTHKKRTGKRISQDDLIDIMKDRAKNAKRAAFFGYMNKIITDHPKAFESDLRMVIRLLGLFTPVSGKAKEPSAADIAFHKALYALTRANVYFEPGTSYLPSMDINAVAEVMRKLGPPLEEGQLNLLFRTIHLLPEPESSPSSFPDRSA